MTERYDPKAIEPKWQKKWEEQGIFRQYDRERKFYALDMFPYPSGAGLHVGHPKGYIATDVIARAKQLQGHAVLHPMGWDAFGLPAEQYAIKTKTHPREATAKNVATFKRQLESLGFTYDWNREINTTDPEYYKWTQWAFLQMFKKGLAFESYEPINWCPSCKTGLANEDLEDGKCERCGSEIEKKPMRQWVLRITDYADRLLSGLDGLDWPESIKESQRNWIGRSEGTIIQFRISNSEFRTDDEITNPKSQSEEGFIEVFTTRVDTLFGCAYVVVAPEHPLIREQITENSKQKFRIKNQAEVVAYLEETKKKTEMERTAEGREKTGVRLEGIMAVNPINGEEVPVFVADYVLGDYGTGAVMAVPAHDERDYAFAKKYGLPIRQVIKPEFGTPRENEEYRSGGCAIVFDPASQKYAVYRMPQGIVGFFAGGVEEGEDMQVGILREVTEESGLDDFSDVELIGEANAHYYHLRKKLNRVADATCILVKLKSTRTRPHTREAHEDFELDWLTPQEILDNWNAHDVVSGREHWIWFLRQAVGRAIELGWDTTSDPGEFSGSASVDDGTLVSSGEFSGLSSAEAREKISVKLEAEGQGRKTVKYKLRDWVFSRQRYWGEPIPLVHCEKCGVVPVPEAELPVLLPDVESYEPTGTGESPLAAIDSWVNTACPVCGGPAKRETNTMPQWAGSSWYYLRYIDPKNADSLVGADEEKRWMPVDVYVGGAEHATRHLIYARFWHKFLFDQGAVSTDEPFRKLVNVGLILASDGRKMSKRWGNVVNPDDVVSEFGADALRLYEMFMGPFSQMINWNTDGVVGTRRFLEKAWKLREKLATDSGQPTTGKKIDALLHRTIVKVTEDIDAFRFNTAVSSLMELSNVLGKEDSISRVQYETFLVLLSPFAPHIAEELWEKLGNTESIFLSAWPEADPALLVADTLTIVVQVNGKMRDSFEVPADISEDELRAKALASEKLKPYLDGKEPKRVIVVPGKLVNVVV